MDRHSEVEIKFRADRVSLERYHRFIHGMPAGCQAVSYKQVRGDDTYYLIGNSAVRYRSDGGGGVLTYKQRKSASSIMNRVEIDLPFSDEVQPKDVEAVLGYLGALKSFTISKTSYIYRLTGKIGNREYEATVALYDVWRPGRPDLVDRFLEVEVERNNKCSPKIAVKALDAWRRSAQASIEVGEPLNSSLYEIYSKENH